MSLWATPIDQIDFTHIDTFLKEKVPEGVRLDYKIDAANLDKVMCAFANTLGGLILLGVDENPNTNEPVWPPSPARVQFMLPDGERIRDQIFGLASANIYPPLRIQVSRVIPNQLVPGKGLVVIRVDMSKDAPHAIEKKQEAYVVRKADNVSERFTLADIDRIEHLLERRKRIVEKRDEAISAALARALDVLVPTPSDKFCPVFWIGFTPYYPVQMCNKHLCYDLHGDIKPNPYYHNIQRTPEGSLSRLYERLVGGILTFAVSEIHDTGLVFLCEKVASAYPNESSIKFERVAEQLNRTVLFVRKFISNAFERPGLCLLRVGFRNIKDTRLKTMEFNGAHAASRNPMVHSTFAGVRTQKGVMSDASPDTVGFTSNA